MGFSGGGFQSHGGTLKSIQIINFRLGCPIINHPFLGCRKPGDFLAGH